MKPTFPSRNVAVALGALFTLPALAVQTPQPTTGEILLNQTITAASQSNPYVALQPGGFAAIWEDASSTNLRASIFDNAGGLTVPEFTVRFSAFEPGIATAADGSIITSASDGDADGNGVFFQLFSSAGAVGFFSAVNTTTAGSQSDTRVASRPNGDYAVVWQSPDADGSGVFLRLFQANGTPITGEIAVNTTTGNDQDTAAVAVADDGRVFVAWESLGQDGSSLGISARIFDATGAALGAEIPVNTFTANAQDDPRIACDPAGNFVVVWESSSQDGDGDGIYAQRFSRTGAKIGPETLVNTTTAGSQTTPVVGVGPDGTFVVAWESSDADGDGVFFQRFDLLANVRRGVETAANLTIVNDQDTPDIVLGSGRRMVLAWESVGQDGSNEGCYARLYTLEPPNASTGQPLVRVKGPARRVVKKNRLVLRGTALDNGAVAQVQLKLDKKPFRSKGVTGTESWKTTVRLKPGKNRVILRARDNEGEFSAPKRLVITRAS